jgi:signal peptidase I
MNTYYPLCTFENLQIEEAGAEVVVFHTQAKTFHLLNPVAYAILKACNGSNNVRDIAGILSSHFQIEDFDSVVADVTETIKSFESKGLMWFVADEPLISTIASEQASDNPLFSVSLTGASMFPVLYSGDKALVKKTALEELRIGDIVIWIDRAQERVAHRIISLDTSSTPALITTKGDVHCEADAPVAFNRVLGKIVAVLRDGELKWLRELQGNNGNAAAENGDWPKRRPSYKELKVLDLREVSVESVRNIESVEDVSLVLLSPENEHAWPQVTTKDVKSVYTAPKEYRVYTGQPEFLPEMLEFLDEPLRLIVSGQLFLTSFEPQQIREAFKELIVLGQVYVSSEEAKATVESFAKIITGGISIVPAEHARWIGESILGPEYLHITNHAPLVAIGDLSISERMKEIPDGIALYR